ncbi:MAG: cytochrome C oxidase subunit IV family protein [Candidatus Lindowbacteria bacterium]|nr:cytochrome C oxidase subunit IV family protein [Candidatus Lindowbacteria bacterium]
MSGHSPEEINKLKQSYLKVLGALVMLTAVTVGVSYLEFGTQMAIIIALLVALVKGSLVCMVFMHLSDEKKWIYWSLLLTVVFFTGIMLIPVSSFLNSTILVIITSIIISVLSGTWYRYTKHWEPEN